MNTKEMRSSADIEKTHSRLQKLEKKVTDLTSQLIHFQDLVNTVKRDNENKNQQIHSFQKQIKEQKTLLYEKEEKHHFLMDQLDIWKAKIEEAKQEDLKQIAESEEITKKLSEENKKVRFQLQAVKKEKEDIFERIETLQGVIDALKSKNSQLSRQYQKALDERKTFVKILKNFWLFLSEKEYNVSINVFYKIFLRILENFEQDPLAIVTSLSLAKDLNYTPDVIYSELKELAKREIIYFSETSKNEFYRHEINIF